MICKHYTSTSDVINLKKSSDFSIVHSIMMMVTLCLQS